MLRVARGRRKENLRLFPVLAQGQSCDPRPVWPPQARSGAQQVAVGAGNEVAGADAEGGAEAGEQGMGGGVVVLGAHDGLELEEGAEAIDAVEMDADVAEQAGNRTEPVSRTDSSERPGD